MSNGRWAVIAGAVVAVGAAGALAIWRPWETSPSSSVKKGESAVSGDLGALLDPATTVTLVCVNRSGSPCKVTVAAAGASIRGNMSAELSAVESRSSRLVFSGPCTVESVTVEREGKSRRQEFNVTIPKGETYDVQVNPDDKVEVRPSPR